MRDELMAWKGWKHAFAVGSASPAPPTDEQIQLIDRVCDMIRSRKMELVAVTTLEMFRPLNYLTAQGLYFLEPFATTVLNKEEYRQFVQFLERRDAVDLVCQRLQPSDGSPEDSNPIPSDQMSEHSTQS